jgi:trimethylamine--corrinoid protein Co-methyltransferase
MGHEKTFTALVAALAGASDVYGAGMTESGVTFDPAMLVMDDEWIAMIRFFLGGIRVDAETIAGADIAAVGPFGDYLSLPSTYAHMREQSQPRLMDRRVREDWQAAGATDLYERGPARSSRATSANRSTRKSSSGCGRWCSGPTGSAARDGGRGVRGTPSANGDAGVLTTNEPTRSRSR